MSNARISFEVEGVKHSLYFGMVATELITAKSVRAAKNGSVDNLRAFAYIIFGGLCNYADTQDIDRPEFEVAYSIAEEIASDNDLTTRIYSSWESSKPYTELTETLNKLTGNKKKAKVKTTQKTGKK